MRAVLRVVSLLVAALVAVAAAAGAAGGPDPARGRAADRIDLGIVMPSEFRQVPELAGAMELARVRTVWNKVQPSCAAIRNERFRWGAVDRILARYTGRGIPLLMTIRGGPDCALERDGSGTALEPKRSYRPEFARFAREVVQRYGPRAKRGGAGECCGITQLEVWNEPNIVVKWSNPDGTEYGHFLKLVSRKVRGAKASRGVRIVSGGITSGTAAKFLREMYRVPKVERAYDALGLHTYNATAAGALDRIAQVRRVMGRARDRSPIAITEHGWSTCAEPSAEFSGKCVGRGEQADELSELLRGLFAKPRFGVDSFLWYTPQDTGRAANERDCPRRPKFFYGFFDRAGDPKPAWDVWREAPGAAGPDRLEPPPPSRQDDCK